MTNTVKVQTVTVSEVGVALILLDQELRNNIDQKRRLASRMQRLQSEIDNISLESLRCQERIDASKMAIDRLSTSHDYQLIYGPKGK
jgi:hypothetical protein